MTSLVITLSTPGYRSARRRRRTIPATTRKGWGLWLGIRKEGGGKGGLASTHRAEADRQDDQRRSSVISDLFTSGYGSTHRRFPMTSMVNDHTRHTPRRGRLGNQGQQAVILTYRER